MATLYVTYNDLPGGIYYSQVIDVVRYMQTTCKEKVYLISFISVRDFFNNRRKIKEHFSNSIVLPMFPGFSNWRLNRFYLLFISLFYFNSIVISRGIFAWDIVYPFRKVNLIKKLVLDARGAYKAEFEEYKIYGNKDFIQKVYMLEQQAVLNSDFVNAVSNKLVRYWKDSYGYASNNYSVIPCTLAKTFIKDFPTKIDIEKSRASMDYLPDDIVLVFSGSISGWQSLSYFDEILNKLFLLYSNLKVLLIGHHDLSQYKIAKQFPERIKQIMCGQSEVINYLYMGDYGWLVREQSITNKVASPVKFAEYLAAGLSVIISENLGDYSDFCLQYNCGSIFSEQKINHRFKQVSYEDKKQIHELAIQHFTKETYKDTYLKILNKK